MKRLLTAALLSLTCFTVHAEWIEITKSVTGNTYYVDPATKKRKGNIVRMWDFVVFAKPALTPDNKPYSSEKTHLAYNCDDDTFRILYIAGYPDKKGESSALFVMGTPGNWESIVPNSVLDTRLRFACDRGPS